MTRATDCSS